MTGGGGCCCGGRRNKISPSPGTESEYKIIEIRPKRHLRIRHINSVPRDDKFETEMATYLMYRREGYPSSVVSSGPMTLPKRKVVSENPAGPQRSQLPNSMTISESPDPKHLSALQNGTMSGLLSKESTFGGDSPFLKNDIQSASGVILSVQQQKHPQGTAPEQCHQKPITKEALKTSAGLQKTETVEQAKVAGNDSVLFFIHGVGGSSDIWTSQLEYFANEGYEIVAPDLIGHGFSDTPTKARAYHFDEILADVEELFDKYCKRKNVIIAHSYGCSFAAVLGRRRARRVTKLVLISGGGPTPLYPQPGLFSLPVCILGCVRPCIECSFKRSAFVSNKKPVIAPEEAFAIPTYVLRHTMNGQIWPDGDELFHNWLMCPTLLLYGLKDALISLQEEKDMEQAIFQSRLEVISDASHMVMIESPHEVNRLVKEFLHQTSHLPEQQTPPPRAVSQMSQRSTRSAKSARGSKTMR